MDYCFDELEIDENLFFIIIYHYFFEFYFLYLYRINNIKRLIRKEMKKNLSNKKKKTHSQYK
jgi:hypothetical protein